MSFASVSFLEAGKFFTSIIAFDLLTVFTSEIALDSKYHFSVILYQEIDGFLALKYFPKTYFTSKIVMKIIFHVKIV